MLNFINHLLENSSYNSNILNKKISDIKGASKYNLKGGGSNEYFGSNCTRTLIGILLLGIGFYLYWNRNDWINTEAKIIEKICDSKTKSCKIKITYNPIDELNPNSDSYSKTIYLQPNLMYQIGLDSEPQYPININSISNTIGINYQKSNPNVVRLYEINYYNIGVVLIILGLYFVIPSILE